MAPSGPNLIVRINIEQRSDASRFRIESGDGEMAGKAQMVMTFSAHARIPSQQMSERRIYRSINGTDGKKKYDRKVECGGKGRKLTLRGNQLAEPVLGSPTNRAR